MHIRLPKDPAAYTLRGLGPKLKRFLGKVQFLEEAIALYYCAIDPMTPVRAKAVAFAALAYFIMPVDLVPDTIPVAGMLDDATVIALAAWALQHFITEEHRRKARCLLAKLLGERRDECTDDDAAGASIKL